MRVKTMCTAVMLLAFVSVGNSYADQKIKTKSNIKNDRIAQPVESTECAEKCAEGERCVKPAADAEKTADGKSYCVASDVKSSVAASVKE